MSESGVTIPEELRERLARFTQMAGESQQRTTDAERDLANADDERLKAVLLDRSQPDESRGTALGHVLRRLNTSKELGPLLRSLWDDPNGSLALQAIRYLPPFDLEGREALFGLLNDPRPDYWSTAALTLARHKVSALLPLVREWLDSADLERFNVAVGCLPWLQFKDDRRDTLADAWNKVEDNDPSARARRAYLAAQLLELGDDVGLEFLDDVALDAADLYSPFAANALYSYAADVGLDRMGHILDKGPPEVRIAMAQMIQPIANLPQPFSVDTLEQARRWVEARKAELESPPDQNE